MKKVFLGLALAGVIAFAVAPAAQAVEPVDGGQQITEHGCGWGGGWGGGRGGRGGRGWGGGGNGGGQGWGGGGGCWGGW